jgi:AraC family transcriptional regulator, melibiose operon regulatory protein
MLATHVSQLSRLTTVSIWENCAPSSEFQRHDKLEMAFVERGEMRLRHGRSDVTLGAGDLAFFLGAIPHVAEAVSGRPRVYRLTVPVPAFLGWHLPSALSRRLMSGDLIVDRGGIHTRENGDSFRLWAEELAAGDARNEEITLLEAEARMRRLARALGETSPEAFPGAPRRVAAMAQFIAASHSEPLRIDDIARIAHMNAHRAEDLFHEACGMSLHECVNRHRIADAQWLLTTTDKRVIDIALEAGFGSVGRFYANFRRECGVTPRRYRLLHAERRHPAAV